jgi:TolA-binding protein
LVNAWSRKGGWLLVTWLAFVSPAPAQEEPFLAEAEADVLELEAHQDEKHASEMERQEREHEKQQREQERLDREEERKQREEERKQHEEQRAQERVQRAEEAYDRGTEALDEGRWDRAAAAFGDVCRTPGARCDGALYWKAYALGRLGRRPEAAASLAELRQSYPQSRWLSEAKALELELQQKSGQPAAPQSADDEEL